VTDRYRLYTEQGTRTEELPGIAAGIRWLAHPAADGVLSRDECLRLIASKLDRPFMDVLMRSGRAQTKRLLNEYIPEGAPWSASWHEPDRWGNVLSIQATLPPETGLPVLP
jgi:hypothetical protein